MTTLLIMQPRSAVKVGNSIIPRTDDVSNRGCRTQEQYDAVMAYFRTSPSAYWTTNPFRQEYPGQRFRCGFRLSYVDTLGQFVTIWVRPDGEITEFNGGDRFTFISEADAVRAQYGAFAG